MVRVIAIVACSSANAWADMRAMYTWRSWLFGWLGRMVAQVTFFTFLGTIVDRPGVVVYLFIGNAVMTAVIESLMVVASSTWERSAGTFPLLVAAPAHLTWVFFGRSLQWPVSGTATSLVALFALGPLFGVTWRPAQLLPVAMLVFLGALATYCFGLFLAALVINAPAVRNIVSNATYLLLMAMCGVQVPLDFWPEHVRAAAMLMPVTHAVAAVREIHDGASAVVVGRLAVLVVVAAVAWFGAAFLAFHLMARRGRATGTVDFAG